MERAKRAMQWLARQIGGACGASIEELAIGEQIARAALDEARRIEDVDCIGTYAAMVDGFVAYRAFIDAALPIGDRLRQFAGPKEQPH